MTMSRVIISFSAGTMVLLVMMLSVSIIAVGYFSSQAEERYVPSEGIKSTIERLENDLKYGKVNIEAAKEVKNGLPLFDRMRANRQARMQPQQCAQPTQARYCQPAQSYRVVDQSDCAYSYIVSNPVPNQAIVFQTVGVEYPSVTTPTAVSLNDCTDGRCTPRKATKVEAVKTGSFICSNCRKPKIADWHTEWKEDGTPETFLCKSCYSFMTPVQRKAAFDSYRARQFKSAGEAGLLQQEVQK